MTVLIERLRGLSALVYRFGGLTIRQRARRLSFDIARLQPFWRTYVALHAFVFDPLLWQLVSNILYIMITQMRSRCLDLGP